MGVITLVVMVWGIAVIGCAVMKKIAPETFKPYLIYVVCICIVFTCFVGWYTCVG